MFAWQVKKRKLIGKQKLKRMNIKAYIKSGILESYVLGMASAAEIAEVEKFSSVHSEIKMEIEEISKALELYAEQHRVEPHAAIKTLLMATIDYTKRMESGEPQSFPQHLNEHSKIKDYQQWLDREDMVVARDFQGMFAKIIGYSEEATTAIVWIKNMAPEEIHHNEYEKFLIVEGTCEIIVDGKVNELYPGDYFAIPLHSDHHVQVTSKIPCKVILQRVAA